MLLRPARVHALQHLGPILRLGAASAGVDLDIGVVGVGLAGQQAFDLAPLRLLGKCAQCGKAFLGHGLIAVALRQADQFKRIGYVAFKLADPFHLGGNQVPFAHDLLRGGGVIPEVGIFGARVQLSQTAFGDIPVKDASSAARWTA